MDVSRSRASVSARVSTPGALVEAGGEEDFPPWAHDYPRAERNFMNILSGDDAPPALYGRWKIYSPPTTRN